MHTSLAHRVTHQPNVTPMIDVMLVLLIIFMLVVPALESGAVAHPPAAFDARARPDSGGDVVLTLDRDGRARLRGRLVAAGALERTLRDLFTARGSGDRLLYVKADRDLPYEAVLDALDAARRGGVRVAGMITERPAREGR